LKKAEKDLKRVLTNGNGYDIISKLSSERASPEGRMKKLKKSFGKPLDKGKRL